MGEEIFAAVVRRDEAEPLGIVEPLDGTRRLRIVPWDSGCGRIRQCGLPHQIVYVDGKGSGQMRLYGPPRPPGARRPTSKLAVSLPSDAG